MSPTRGFERSRADPMTPNPTAARILEVEVRGRSGHAAESQANGHHADENLQRDDLCATTEVVALSLYDLLTAETPRTA